jgi:hypothetical protein
LERLLGRKTMEVEILKEALDLARAKIAARVLERSGDRFAMTLLTRSASPAPISPSAGPGWLGRAVPTASRRTLLS